MAALLLVSIAILALGIVTSLIVMIRSGETRVGLLSLGFALLGSRQVSVLLNSWDDPIALDTAGLAEIAIALACATGLATVAALWKTLRERDHAESLHWDSMEAVRVLSELAVRWDLSLDEKLAHLLKIGCDRLDLEIGSISRIEAQRYEVIALRAPEGYAVEQGSVFLLADTVCALALDKKRPVAFERIDDAVRPAHAERAPFEFRSYLGATVRVYGEPVGTISFGGRKPRRRRFAATDKDLTNLMAQWVGTELERRLMAEERESNGARETARAEKQRTDARLTRAIDVNAAIRRNDKNLRAAIGPGVDLDVRLAKDLQKSIRLHVTVGAIIESVVHQAKEILTEGARLTIATANLRVASQSPDVVPAVAPDDYVTVTLSIASERIAADSLEHAFEPAGSAAESGGRGWELQPHLTLGAIYRLLQRSGGDLSLEVEPGVGATITLYLPPFTAQSPRPNRAQGRGLPARPA